MFGEKGAIATRVEGMTTVGGGGGGAVRAPGLHELLHHRLTGDIAPRLTEARAALARVHAKTFGHSPLDPRNATDAKRGEPTSVADALHASMSDIHQMCDEVVALAQGIENAL